MRFKLTTTLLCLGLLAGCASAGSSVEYKNNPQWSEARNVMEAAHIHAMQDLPYAKYQEAKEDALKKGMKLDTGPSLLGGTTFGALNYISPPTGFSSGAAGVMGLASWLLIGKEHPGLQSRIFVWMPADTVSSPEEAINQLYKLFKDALEATVKEVHWPDGYTAHVATYPPSTGLFVVITGGECDTGIRPIPVSPALRCRYGGFPSLNGFAVFSGPLPKDITPDFLGGGGAYAWQGWAYSNFYASLILDQSKVKTNSLGTILEWRAGLPDVEFYTTLTKHLPKWVYFYLAPQHWSSYDGAKYILPKYPVVINQGRVLYFIEPAPATAAAR